MLANTPVSNHETVIALPVKILSGTLVRFINANVFGNWFKSLVVTVNPVVTVQIVMLHVMV